jgi:1-deoxy-D-xylulose-5-phosphate reductoisomerase
LGAGVAVGINVLKNGVAILGATGSIGTQTLDVMRTCLPDVPVRLLTAFGNINKLAESVKEFAPDTVWLPDDNSAIKLKNILPPHIKPEILTGTANLTRAAAQTEADIVVNALIGQAGLAPTLAAIQAGKHIALANKETLVSAGSLIMAAARKKNIRITPIDSEHSAIWQCLQGNDGKNSNPYNPYEKIILTASGGPFRTWPREKITAEATAAEALKHPNWLMGEKITIDSATLMNKGLEYIEAMHLFNAAPEQIEIVIHPQSIIHSAVQFADGAVMAQMGTPDMRLPIVYALSGPVRTANPYPRLNLLSQSLTFEPPDEKRFPCLALAKHAAALGGTAPAFMNAVNEWAVGQFLRGAIKFYDISAIISQTLDEYTVRPLTSHNDVTEAERRAAELVTAKGF